MATNLHDHAYRGTLTEELLQRFLAGADPSFINSIGGEKKLTPLAAACLRGHLDVVRLLLENRADANAVSSRERPPLFYVTSRTTNNRLDIARALLNAGADVDKRFPKDENATALMNALTEVRDKDLVHELVDHGASLSAKNDGGQSVRDLAKEVGMDQELLTKQERNATRGAVIDLIVALVMFVIAYVNSGLIKDVAFGTISKLYEVSGAKGKNLVQDMAKDVIGDEAAKRFTQRLEDPPTTQPVAHTEQVRDSKPNLNVNTEPKSAVDTAEYCMVEPPILERKPAALSDRTNQPQPAPSEPKPAQTEAEKPSQTTTQREPELISVEDFKNSLGDYVRDTGLEKFFARDDPFIQTLAVKAAALRADQTTPLSKPENIKRLVTLSLYHPVIFCDDSGSMSLDNRFAKQRALVGRMARIATKIVPDDCGVDLRFINARVMEQNLSMDGLDRILARTQPRGGTRIGSTLRRDILVPLVYSKIDAGSQFKRPLLVCAITDGDPSSEPVTAFKDVIVECRRRLVAEGYEPTSVMFCISQIGNDQKAAAFLSGLRDDEEIRDVLYCTAERLDGAFDEMRANEGRLEEWLLKVLTKPIMERYEE
ncbi:hypothetical protein EVJ58_g458 [Rhodofomes roseus]|uniref:Uncharacterized protein n=1 Tax=Rhodofomes roseus TaxID=34475 RepID=A0A4Y9Z5N8_9APHY|nr:hypothetical protein EVJ58_g458 [Rhodofomes roseus]